MRCFTRVVLSLLLLSLNFTIARAASENRSGFVEYRITINNKSSYSGTLRCSGQITPNYPYTVYSRNSRDIGITLASTTKTASCVVKIAFNWTGVDVTKLIDGSIQIESTWCECATNRLNVYLDVPSFSYPSNGATAVVDVTVDI